MKLREYKTTDCEQMAKLLCKTIICKTVVISPIFIPVGFAFGLY